MDADSLVYIPKTLKVGFQKRSDTYDGKLSYVTYIDEKGKHRKQTSWENWRDKDIEPRDVENIPTSGFVLNKSVGGVRQSWGWNTRQEYARIYDPRGFEFEITFPNLLYILQYTDCLNKEIVSECVYAWHGKELVLVPIVADEYQNALAYTKTQLGKVSARDLQVGTTYITKKMNHVVYLGRYMCYWYEMKGSNWKQGIERYGYNVKKHHMFYELEDKYIKATSSMSFLSKALHTDHVENAAEYLDIFKNRRESAPITHLSTRPIRNLPEVPEEITRYNYSTYMHVYGKINESRYESYNIGLDMSWKYDNALKKGKYTLNCFYLYHAKSYQFNLEDFSLTTREVQGGHHRKHWIMFATLEEIGRYIKSRNYVQVFAHTLTQEIPLEEIINNSSSNPLSITL